LLRLLARAIDHSNEREGGEAALNMSFDLDPTRFEADQCERDRAREHPSKLGTIL
jgi:hypothetical protein